MYLWDAPDQVIISLSTAAVPELLYCVQRVSNISTYMFLHVNSVAGKQVCTCTLPSRFLLGT